MAGPPESQRPKTQNLAEIEFRIAGELQRAAAHQNDREDDFLSATNSGTPSIKVVLSDWRADISAET